MAVAPIAIVAAVPEYLLYNKYVLRLARERKTENVDFKNAIESNKKDSVRL